MRRAIAAVLCVACIAALPSCGWRGLNSFTLPGTAGGGPGSYTIQAQMPDVVTIQENTRVRVDDVNIGNVTKIELCFASDFAAEIRVGNYPRLAVFSGDPRGVVHARVQRRSAPSDEPVGGDEVGDLPASHRWRDVPGRGGAQVAGGCVDGDWDPARRQGRRFGGVSAQAGTARYSTGLAVGGGQGRDRAADRGGQGAGDRAGGCAGKIRL